jgi:hypothetical protein
MSTAAVASSPQLIGIAPQFLVDNPFTSLNFPSITVVILMP